MFLFFSEFAGFSDVVKAAILIESNNERFAFSFHESSCLVTCNEVMFIGELKLCELVHDRKRINKCGQYLLRL